MLKPTAITTSAMIVPYLLKVRAAIRESDRC
jgi:hypothetical protein